MAPTAPANTPETASIETEDGVARLVYGCRFEVPGSDAWASTVAPTYADWIKARYAKAYGVRMAADLATGAVAGSLPEGHALDILRHVQGTEAVDCRWTFPGDKGLKWRNAIRFGVLADRCVVEHRVELESAEYLLAPAHFSVGAPAVIRDICERYEVYVGPMRIRAVVYPLSPGSVSQFVSLLESDLRRLPLVLVTPYANGDRGDLDAARLANRLAGVAIVTEADSPEATRALSDRLGRLGCFDGGVRVYWPGFQLRDDVRSHPLMLGSRVALLGADRASSQIERSIFSVVTFRFVPDARIDAIVAKSEATQRQERADVARQEGDSTWEQYALEMSAQLDAALEDLKGLRAENANLRENQQVLFSLSDAGDAEPASQEQSEREPATVLEAVEFGQQDFKHLLFLDDAFRAAANSPFKRPPEIYEVLGMMDRVASVWRRNEGGGDLRQMLRDEGLGKRVSNFISQTSQGKWGDEYTFTYDGTKQLFSWHVTLGSGAADTCASIHFLPDSSAGKLVIGHVGRHLTNTRA